jgi:hypothetical protein
MTENKSNGVCKILPMYPHNWLFQTRYDLGNFLQYTAEEIFEVNSHES